MKLLALLLTPLLLAACASDPEPVRSGAQPVARSPASPPSSLQVHRAAQRAAVVRHVQSMLGAPYQYGGTTPAGFDCSGLVWYSHQQSGIQVPRTSAQQFRTVKNIDRRRMAPGDLLFFRISRSRGYHVATYLGGGRFIHAPSSGKQVSTDSLDNPYWRKRLVKVGNYYR